MSTREKIDSVYDFTEKGLVEVKAWLEPWFRDEPQADCCSDSGTPRGDFAPYVISLSDLIGYWRLGETAPPFADTSGYDPGDPADLTLVTRGAAYTPDQGGALPAAQDDGAVKFNSNGTPGDYLISGGDPGRFDMDVATQPYTVGAWVKVLADAGSFTGTVVSQRASSPDEGWSLDIQWPALVAYFSREELGGSFIGVNSAALNVGQWYYLTGVYDYNAGSPMLYLYVNGALVDSASVPVASMPSWNNGVKIGGSAPNVGFNYYFYGTIDEVAIWRAARTAEEILELYERGAAELGVAPAGQVRTADGTGGTYWAYPGVYSNNTYVTVQVGPPAAAYISPLVFDSTLVTGGLYGWDGSAYQQIGPPL